MKILRTIVLATVSMAAVGCGEPCKQLEEKMCADLGNECEIWRKNDRPGFPGTGSRPTKSCVNALGNYDVHLKSAKTVVKALKEGEEKAKASRAKAAASSKGDDKGDSKAPKPAVGDAPECEELHAKLCAELGEVSCEKWQAAGKPGLKANKLQCKMALDKPTFYQRHLKSVRAAIK